MVKTTPAKTVRYLLVIPISALSSPHPINQSNDEQKEKKKKTRRLCASNCKCLVGLFGGLALAILLAIAITIPIVVNLPTEENETTTTTIATTRLSSMTTITTTTSTTTITTTTSTTTTTDIPCSISCTSQQTCVRGVCVGIGYLSCTLTWSRSGDGDIVLTTPNNNIIYYNNMGPNASTDQGQLDVDDKIGMGPENIFWSNSSTVPPTGVYYICFSQFSFSPSASSFDPITATITVVGSTNTVLTMTKTFTTVITNATSCTASSPHLLISFTYP